MRSNITWLFSIAGVMLSLFATGCASPNLQHQSAFTYTAKIVNGQIFLSLNSSPDQVIGPLVKRGNDYIHSTQDQGEHTLRKSQDGAWYYNWSYIHSTAEPVDGRALEEMKSNQTPEPTRSTRGSS